MTTMQTEQPAPVEATEEIKAEALAEHARLMSQPVSRAPSPTEIAGNLDSIWQEAAMLHTARLGGPGATQESVAARILGAYELGKGPVWGLRHLYLVHDRLGMSAEAMRGLFLERCRGGRLTILESDETHCRIAASRPGQEPTEETFCLAEAKHAGLVVEKSNWGKWPTDMCCARATARLARRYWPDILGGCGYTPEELAENPPTAPPAPTPEADADAPRAPTRGQRQAAPQTTEQQFAALAANWKALAVGVCPELSDAEKRDGFLRWAASVLKTDKPLDKMGAWTAEDLAACRADLDERHDPRPAGERQADDA